MAKKTVRDVDLRGKRVLVRVDFNVPLKEGRVTDDTRIRAALPTIEYLREQGCRVILMSHLGRPKDGPDAALRLDPVAMRLGPAAGRPGAQGERAAGRRGGGSRGRAMKPGDVLLLENSRFDPREKKNDPELVQRAGPSGRCVRQRRLQRRSPGSRHHGRAGRRAARGRRASRWRRK